MGHWEPNEKQPVCVGLLAKTCLVGVALIAGMTYLKRVAHVDSYCPLRFDIEPDSGIIHRHRTNIVLTVD